MKRFYFAVVGAREFPLDMLRYDACFPAREEDALRAERHPDERRIVVLAQQVDDKCSRYSARLTDGRWSSFGWRVVSASCDDALAAEDSARVLSGMTGLLEERRREVREPG